MFEHEDFKVGYKRCTAANICWVFVSLTVLDLTTVREAFGEGLSPIFQDVMNAVRDSIRACDYVELLNEESLALLFPETPRQGAETAARRLADLVRERLCDLTDRSLDGVIPVEIASYPDTAGARPLSGFLEELVSESRN